MHQVAEEFVAERVVAHVLDDAAAVRVSVRGFQIVGSRLRKALQEQRLDCFVPRRIHNRFMSEDGIGCGRWWSGEQKDNAKGNRSDSEELAKSHVMSDHLRGFVDSAQSRAKKTGESSRPTSVDPACVQSHTEEPLVRGLV